LSDQYGRRWIVIVGNVIALIGGIAGGTAQHAYVVMIGLLICGLGLGGQSQAVAILSQNFRRKNRGWVRGDEHIPP
jgi:MFS family permease